MKKPVLAVAVVGALTASIAFAPAAAAESSLSSEETSSTSSTSSEGNWGTAVVILAILAALGAGAAWALPMLAPPAPAPSRGDCSPEAIDRDFPEWGNDSGDWLVYTVVNYCDGHFAWANRNATDWYLAFQWNGTQWEPIPHVGVKQDPSRRGCYNGLTLREQGAAEEFITMIPICTPEEVGNFNL